MSQAQGSDPQPDRRLTVAVVNEHAGHATVRFLESARIYRLPRTNPDYAVALRTLQAAARGRTAVHVRLDAPESETIVGVRAD